MGRSIYKLVRTQVFYVSTPQLSGEELFNRYQDGDEEAFVDIVKMYMEGLAIFINNIVNDEHEVEHLTIEAFARLAVGGRKFARKSSLKTYLYTIGKNLAVQHVKKRKGEQHLSFDEMIRVIADEVNGRRNNQNGRTRIRYRCICTFARK